MNFYDNWIRLDFSYFNFIYRDLLKLEWEFDDDIFIFCWLLGFECRFLDICWVNFFIVGIIFLDFGDISILNKIICRIVF